MRTIEEVRDLATQLVGPDLADRAVSAVVPAWYLVEDREGPMRIGGPAPLTAEEDWPVGDHGLALTFVASLPLSALPQLPQEWEDRAAWSRRGQTLRIFADLVANPHEPAPALILPTDPEAALTDTAAPEVPDPFPELPDFDLLDVARDVRVRELPETRVSFVAGLTVDEFALGLIDDEDYDETWEEFVDALWHEPNGAGFSKVGGAPRWTMDDPRDAGAVLPEDPGTMAVVLELHSIGAIHPPNDGAYVISALTSALGTKFSPALCWVGG